MSQSNKIIILSPAFPYRGGIAATSDRLAQEYINRGQEVEIWTYKMLYPKVIFPGKSQYLDPDKHQKPKNYTIRRKIVSINPFNWLKVGRELKKMAPAKLIVRYWLPFLGPCLGTICRIARKNKVTKAIGLIDNVMPHESRVGDHQLSNYFYKRLDGFLVMAKKGEHQLVNAFKIQKPIIYSPHPLFDIYGEPVSKGLAAKQLKLDASIPYILSFGLIRKYKGIDLLLEAFASFRKDHPTHKLLLVGECYDDWSVYQEQIDRLSLNEDVIRFDHFVPDNEVHVYFSVADFLALTYKSATQSGVTQIAYSMELPILVTDVGDLANMVPHEKVGRVSPLAIAAIAENMAIMADPDNLVNFKKGIKEEKKRFEWSVLCENLEQF